MKFSMNPGTFGVGFIHGFISQITLISTDLITDKLRSIVHKHVFTSVPSLLPG